MGQVGEEEGMGMAFGEAQGEAAALFEGVLKCVGMVRPKESVAGEGVMKGVVGR